MGLAIHHQQWLITALFFVPPNFKTMTYTYKKQKTVREGEVSNVILRKEDNAFIPFDSANTDYQEYLKWLEDGGVPEEAG